MKPIPRALDPEIKVEDHEAAEEVPRRGGVQLRTGELSQVRLHITDEASHLLARLHRAGDAGEELLGRCAGTGELRDAHIVGADALGKASDRHPEPVARYPKSIGGEGLLARSQHGFRLRIAGREREAMLNLEVRGERPEACPSGSPSRRAGRPRAGAGTRPPSRSPPPAPRGGLPDRAKVVNADVYLEVGPSPAGSQRARDAHVRRPREGTLPRLRPRWMRGTARSRAHVPTSSSTCSRAYAIAALMPS